MSRGEMCPRISMKALLFLIFLGWYDNGIQDLAPHCPFGTLAPDISTPHLNMVHSKKFYLDGIKVASLLEFSVHQDHKITLECLFFNKFSKCFPNHRNNPHDPLMDPTLLE